MLTKKERRIFIFINDFIEEHDYSPSMEEIGSNLNLPVSTTHKHIEAMKNKGYLQKGKKLEPSISRKEVRIRFGDRVIQERLKLGLSQKELASRAGLPKTYIVEVELAKKKLTSKIVQKIAKALNSKISDLFSAP